MKKKMISSILDQRAKRETQVQFVKSDLEPSEEVLEISKRIEDDYTNTELWMDKGIALSKQMLFKEAIDAFSMGLSFNPFHSLSYRYRGHRFISTYEFKQAIADLVLATRLDDMNWDSWYHLGLAYYLDGNFEKAYVAYKRCLELTDAGSEHLVAVIDWMYLTLMRLGKNNEAVKLIEKVNEETPSGENFVYQDRILMYKGEKNPDEVLNIDDQDLSDLELATLGYGVAMHHYFNGNESRTFEIFDKLLENDSYWSAFGYIAAFVDNKRLRS
ncbi:MAG: tetratricopeptide repeat protein [Clostridia bacterium]